MKKKVPVFASTATSEIDLFTRTMLAELDAYARHGVIAGQLALSKAIVYYALDNETPPSTELLPKSIVGFGEY